MIKFVKRILCRKKQEPKAVLEKIDVVKPAKKKTTRKTKKEGK